MGQYVANEGRKWHPQCFNKDVQCYACHKPIFGEAVSSNDKHWHVPCFKCVRCKKELSNDYLERNGDPYCKVCGNEPTAIRRTVVSGKISAEEMAKKQREADQLTSNIAKGKQCCGLCGRVVGTEGVAFEWSGKVYHSACFRCQTCKVEIKPQFGFNEKDGLPYCQKCFKDSVPPVGYCADCGKPIIGSYLSADDAKFHKECFKCAKCRKAFGPEGYCVISNKPHCAACAKSIPSTTSTTTTVYTGDRKGFVIDPRSGKKRYT